uniref:Uncharacterized protein n=1 Tax=Sphaerodactylus townsendi TaxID=933632 RepID=A0ACB8FHF4_9SAUR
MEATKFDISLLKKISLIIAGLIVTIAVVIGCVLFVPDGFESSNQVGLGLIVLPAVILVPLLYILLTSVFEKPPCFAVMLLVLKALGYVIAVTGFAMSVSGPRSSLKSISAILPQQKLMEVSAIEAHTSSVVGVYGALEACPPQHAAVVIAGLAVIDLVAVIALVYVIIIGSNFKDHQPPRKAVEEPLNDAKGVMLE